MKAPGGIAGVIGRISVFLGKSCGILYLTAIALSLYEVFMRYALGMPTAWTNEIIMSLVATAWMLSVGAVTQQHRHITVTAMELIVGEKIWRRMAKLAVLLSMAAAGGLLYASWKPMMSVLGAMQTSGSAFDLPTPTYIKTLLVVVCVLYLLQLFANLITPADTTHDHGTSGDVAIPSDLGER